MSQSTRFHLGGYNAAAPVQNRAELLDSVAGTYTAWDESGNVTEKRALTQGEIASLAAQDAGITAQANGDVLRAKAQAALAANATFLALSAPTNAQTLAQVQRNTRQINAVIRLHLGLLDSADGT